MHYMLETLLKFKTGMTLNHSAILPSATNFSLV